MYNLFENVVDQTLQEFSVSEISKVVKSLIEDEVGYVRVRGEISGLKIASSGHAYFNLKENIDILCCTCWRQVLSRMNVHIVEGLEVVVIGKITAYSSQSRYQLSVDKVEPAGVGMWMQILKERRDILAKEGLFDESRKKALPFIPRCIGVVTSMTGAVIQDIVHRISQRFPMHIMIWPASVQGENSSKEIVAAIEGFNALSDENRPDVIIVARGGGSIEDLWSFNEEIVVRSVAASNIPVISAVGHETDHTLIDLAADLRAPTPTAAAEFVVPVLSDLIYTLKIHHNALLNSMKQLLRYQQQVIRGYSTVLKYPAINTRQQRVDELEFKLTEIMPSLLKLKSVMLKQLIVVKFSLHNILDRKEFLLKHIYCYLINGLNKLIDNAVSKFELYDSLLTSLDYNNILKRGFSIVRDENGKILSSVDDVLYSCRLSVQFYNGVIIVKKEQ